MMRTTTTWGLFLVAVLSLWFAGRSFCEPPFPEPSVAARIANAAGADNSKGYRQAKKDAFCQTVAPVFAWKGANIIATFSAIFAFLILVLTETSNERQLRAYIFVTDCVGFNDGENTCIAFRVRNFGQTPARDVRIALSITIAGHFRPSEPIGPIIMPPQHNQQMIQPLGILLRLDNLAGRIHAKGHLTYVDIFEQSREGTFTAISDVQAADGDVAFVISQEGSDYFT